MNADSIDEEIDVVETVGPGKQLQAGREARNLDRGQVAAELHLDEGTLAALEADDYEKLPGAVFIQGYIRNYARILGVPVEPLLEAFQQAGVVSKPQTRLHFSKMKREVRSNHAVVRTITWMIILGLIALVVVWWRGYIQWPLQPGSSDILSTGELFSSEPAVVEEVAEPRMPVSEIEEAGEAAGEDSTLLPPLPITEETTTGEQLPATMAEVGDSAEEVTDGVATLPIEEATPASMATEEVTSEPVEAAAVIPAESVVEEVATVAPAEEIIETPVAPVNQVDVTFTDESWVDIKDAARSFRVFGVKPASTKVTLEGEPPYSFVIGNAAAVLISVNGEPFDLAAHTRGNVARFTLDPR